MDLWDSVYRYQQFIAKDQMRRKTIILCIIFLLYMSDGLCQVRDQGKDASLDEHYDQVSLPVSTASSPDAEKNWNCYAPIQDSYLPQEFYIPEEIGFSESFYTGTKATLQISMATEYA